VDLAVVMDIPAFLGRHSDTFSYEPSTRRVSLRPAPSSAASRWVTSGLKVTGQDIDEKAEARVVKRLKAKLQGGPTTVGDVRGFLGNPQMGGGPADLYVVSDLEAFVRRYTDTFFHDPVNKTLSLRTAASPSSLSIKAGMEEAEARVVRALQARLRGCPMPLDAILTFLSKRPGSKAQDREVVADLRAFARRHKDIFYYDNWQDPPVLGLWWVHKDTTGWPTDPKTIKTEDALVQRLQTKLKLCGGAMKIDALTAYVTKTAVDPVEVTLVADWEAFVRRHLDIFFFSLQDVGVVGLRKQKVAAAESQKAAQETKKVPSKVPSKIPEVVVPKDTEVRLVQRLKERLGKCPDGSLGIAALKGFLGNPCEGGSPHDARALTDWVAFAARHADTFRYDASGKTPILRLFVLPPRKIINATASVVSPTPTPKNETRTEVSSATKNVVSAMPAEPIEPLKDDLSTISPRSPAPLSDTIRDPEALQRLNQILGANVDSGVCPPLVIALVVSVSGAHTSSVSLSVTDRTYTIQAAAYGTVNLFTALRPLFTNPAVQVFIHDVHHVPSPLPSPGETFPSLIDTQLAFEHLTGHMDVGLKEFIAACPVPSDAVDRPGLAASGSGPIIESTGAGLGGQYFNACKAVLPLINSDLTVIRSATMLRARSAPPAGGFRRVAYDVHCECRLTSHALLAALSLGDLSDSSDTPPPWGSAYLIADILLGRPDLHILVLGFPFLRTRALRDITRTLSDSCCVLTIDGEPATVGPTPLSIRTDRNDRSHDVVTLPEISSADDVHVRDILVPGRGGPRVIAGAAGTLHNLVHDPAFNAFFGTVIADPTVAGGTAHHRRRDLPAFGCVVDCQEDGLTLTMDVAGAVDALLAHQPSWAWARTRDAAGSLFQRRVPVL